MSSIIGPNKSVRLDHLTCKINATMADDSDGVMLTPVNFLLSSYALSRASIALAEQLTALIDDGFALEHFLRVRCVVYFHQCCWRLDQAPAFASAAKTSISGVCESQRHISLPSAMLKTTRRLPRVAKALFSLSTHFVVQLSFVVWQRELINHSAGLIQSIDKFIRWTLCDGLLQSEPSRRKEARRPSHRE